MKYLPWPDLSKTWGVSDPHLVGRQWWPCHALCYLPELCLLQLLHPKIPAFYGLQMQGTLELKFPFTLGDNP